MGAKRQGKKVEPKKTWRRSKVKYPGLDPSVNSKLRWEYIDHDYVARLSDEEKKWLSNFNEEYLSGNMNHPGKKFNKSKKRRKECYDRNNARNRDMYARNRVMSLRTPSNWVGTDKFQSTIERLQDDQTNNPEDGIIEKLDNHAKGKKEG